MTIQWSDNGRSGIGTLKKFNFTYYAREDNTSLNLGYGLFSTSNLPTSSTSTSKATFTVQQSDLPVITPSINTSYTAFLVASGKNTSAGAVTINVQPYINGVSQSAAQTNSVPANNFYSFSVWRFLNVHVGDVLDLYVWASATGMTFDYCAFFIIPTQMYLTKAGTTIKDFNISFDTALTLTQNLAGSGTLTKFDTGTGLTYNLNSSFSVNTGANAISGNGFNTSIGNNGGWTFKAYSGDVNLGQQCWTHSSLRYWDRPFNPSIISFREITY